MPGLCSQYFRHQYLCPLRDYRGDGRRGIACCIALSGAAAGASVFSPLVQNLLDNFGLDGAILIQAGLLLQVSVFAALYRPSSPPSAKMEYVESGNSAGKEDILETKAILDETLADQTLLVEAEESNYVQRSNFVPKTANIHPDCGAERPLLEKVLGHQSAVIASETARQAQLGGSATLYCQERKLAEDSTNETLRRQSSVPTVFINSKPSPQKHSHKNYPYVLDSFQFYSQPVLTSSCLSIPGSISKTPAGVHQDKRVDMQQTKSWRNAVMDHVELFKDRTFVMFLISQGTLHIGVYTPFIFTPSKAQYAGISGHLIPWLVSVMGFSSIAGRVGFGFVADRPGVNRVHLYSASLLISGASTAFCVLFTSLGTLFVYVSVYGAFIGVAISLISVVLVDLIGLTRLPKAFGIINFIDGVACLIGPALGGWLVDISGNYDLTFLVMGSIMAAGALLMHVTEICRKRNP